MTWENRFRLFGGVLVVIAVVLGLAMVFNHRQNQAASFTAKVDAATYTVGADHAGTVVRQHVSVGAEVKRGQKLFEVQSLQLKSELANGLVVADTEAYKVDRDRGIIAYFAVTDGRVEKLEALQGNSVPPGGSLATITGGERYVTAGFHLVPRDYARVLPGAAARITLPNDEVITGEVETVTVASGPDGAVSTLKLDVPELPSLAQQTLAEPGTPVQVRVQLVDSGPLAPLTDAMNDLLQQVGLR